MIQGLATIDPASLVNTLISLTVAFVLGGIIGLERQVRQRTAGLRTNVLVCVGAALFVDIAVRFYEIHGGPTSPLHVMAYVVSGVGFLGAGVIMREEGSVRGINTAATLWASAAVGSAAGADLILESMMGAAFVLAANTLLRPIVNRINRKPLDTENVEATYTFYMIVKKEYREQALTLLDNNFDLAAIPIQDVKVHSFGTGEVEIEAVLLPTSLSGEELDTIAENLRKQSYVNQAFWSPSTTE